MRNISNWAGAHPESVYPLNRSLLSLEIRILEFFRPVRRFLAMFRLAPKRDEIILIIPEGAWDILEETLQMDAVSSLFEAHLRQDISEALRMVRVLDLEERQDDGNL